MNIHFENLRISDIPSLNSSETLYTFDPRILLDECLGKHRYIVSCENLLTNALKDRYIAVNQYAVKHTDSTRNQLITAIISGDPRISIYTRLNGMELPNEIRKLYVAIPHPEADKIAFEKAWEINYSFADFLEYNNKISQKELLGDLTPDWERIDPHCYCFDETENCYFKREVGAGGYATFHASNRTGMKLPSRKYPARWYKEKEVDGKPCSVQIYRHSIHQYTVFGYSEMKIIFKKNYAGGRMKKVECIPLFLREVIASALERLDPLLKDYTGFLGLDFMEEDKKIQVLEANVRVTMATFATLQLNEGFLQELDFYRFT